MKEDFTIPSLIAKERLSNDNDLTFQNRSQLQLRLWLSTMREWELHWFCSPSPHDDPSQEFQEFEVKAINEELISRGLPAMQEYIKRKAPKRRSKLSYLEEFQDHPFAEKKRFRFQYDAAKPNGFVGRTVLQKLQKRLHLFTRSNAELVKYCYQRSDYDFWFKDQIEGEMKRRGLSKYGVDDLKKDRVPVALITNLLSRGQKFSLYHMLTYTGATILFFGIPGMYMGYRIYTNHTVVHSLKVHEYNRKGRWCGLLLGIVGLIVYYNSVEITGAFYVDKE